MADKPHLSLIVAVLESYEVVRRQLLHLGRILTPACELVLVDDGSEPSLEAICDSVPKPFAFTLHVTRDRRPWTQPRARNIGATLARADKLLFFDIDHIVTTDVLERCLTYHGDKLHWTRVPAVLDEQGRVVTRRAVLVEHGMTDDIPSVHANSFLIRRKRFETLGGYDESFCGSYGGDDVDFNRRYAELVGRGLARPEEVAGLGYVYPDPARDVCRLFHSLRGRPGEGRPA
jgi:predicted glycosyltransferase involved in capsule biosynthesis